MTLREIRAKIDAIDARLLDLLNERADLVHEVGLLKKKEGVGVYAPEREEQLLRSLLQRNKGRLPAASIRAIYREIMSASLALEKDLSIAYLGPEGTWAYHAARAKFGASVRYAPQPTIAEVFAQVAQRKADYGVVPLESSTEGEVSETIEAFLESDLLICAQIPLSIADAIHDPAARKGRFLVIGPKPCPVTGDDKTSLLFALDRDAGALCKALEPLVHANISISKIESRGSNSQRLGSVFFIDVDGHVADRALALALKEMPARCTYFKVLGSYPRPYAS